MAQQVGLHRCAAPLIIFSHPSGKELLKRCDPRMSDCVTNTEQSGPHSQRSWKAEPTMVTTWFWQTHCCLQKFFGISLPMCVMDSQVWRMEETPSKTPTK